MALPKNRTSWRALRQAIFVSLALAGKTHGDHFVHCCCLSVVVKTKWVNIWLYLPHALMDFNQSWVIDAKWEPSFVDEVKGHISRSKVTYQGQRSSKVKL